MSSDSLKLVKSEKKRERGDVIGWKVLSEDYVYIFKIDVAEGITITLIDTCIGGIMIAHNPWFAYPFIKRFNSIPQLLVYLETHCLYYDQYMLSDPKHGDVAHVNRRDLIDVLVRCMARMPYYTGTSAEDE